ncbi:MAG: DNA alkylation repair protein [Alistipes sp.]|jgi:3-methyladenine DNA glycosylase AlkD|nr:DNA alkylation repair protein [Alistipes sp.]
MADVLSRLRALVEPGDDEYREFNKRIVVTNYDLLGVRMPALRRLAKQIAAQHDVDEYLSVTPGVEAVYEEVMLYGLVLAARSKRMPLVEIFDKLERLIPLFDSWAHVDVIISDFKIFRKHQDEVFRRFAPLKTHSGEFSKRVFAILMKDFFLDSAHIDTTLTHLAEVPQGQYYTDMAIAWTLAEALVKQYERTEPLLRRPVFSRFVHNKAIQKARESFRLTPTQKEYLNTLKIK